MHEVMCQNRSLSAMGSAQRLHGFAGSARARAAMTERTKEYLFQVAAFVEKFPALPKEARGNSSGTRRLRLRPTP